MTALRPMHEELKLIFADYGTLPDDGKRYEIIDGELYMAPAPREIHQFISANLVYLLYGYVLKHKLGRVYGAPFDVVLGPHDVVQPDLIFVSAENRGIITDANIQGTPDLLVEILSASSRSHDRVRKFRRYARFGLPEYWIIDPDDETVEIYNLREGKFLLTHKCGLRGQVKSTVVTGFACAARDIFEGPTD